MSAELEATEMKERKNLMKLLPVQQLSSDGLWLFFRSTVDTGYQDLNHSSSVSDLRTS
jgi:hypothetical protein